MTEPDIYETTLPPFTYANPKAWGEPDPSAHERMTANRRPSGVITIQTTTVQEDTQS